jgi:hypothetical protein
MQRLYRLNPGYGPDGNSPWDWVQGIPPYSATRDLTIARPGRKAKGWRRFTVRVIREQRTGDHFHFAGGHPVLNDHAWTALEPIIGHCVEPLPINVEGGGELWLLNVLDFVPLGESAEGSYNKVAKAMTWVRRYAFHEEDVEGKVIFRAKGFGFGDCIVSELFKQTAESAGLQGMGFNELDWIRDTRRT